MVRNGLIGGLRRMGAILALLAATLFVLLAQPAEAQMAPEPPAATAAHADHAGDLDGGHHPPGAHCASHCAGHLAGPGLAPALAAATTRALRFRPTEEIEPEAFAAGPPTRPPAA